VPGPWRQTAPKPSASERKLPLTRCRARSKPSGHRATARGRAVTDPPPQLLGISNLRPSSDVTSLAGWGRAIKYP
jgi:hypothetical protein